MLKVHQFPCLSDNYGYLIEDEATQIVAAIDSPDADVIIDKAKSLNRKINQVWNTHWHPDHAGGNAKIKEIFGAQIFGPEEIAKHGFACDKIILPNQSINLGQSEAQIIDVSGHTLGHVAFHFASERLAFVGDALFVLGCGRLFEGNPEMAFAGLSRLMELPDETLVYCAHEYSLANAKFCESLGLSNLTLKARIDEIKALRSRELPTVPTRIGTERKTNPFVLADKENLRIDLGLTQTSDSDIFAFIRSAKDKF